MQVRFDFSEVEDGSRIVIQSLTGAFTPKVVDESCFVEEVDGAPTTNKFYTVEVEIRPGDTITVSN